MGFSDDTHMKFYELRRQAEDFLLQGGKRFPKNLYRDIPKLIHELEVHQIELELQNQELRRSQAELEVSRNKYFELYDLAPVGYLSISETGLILGANLTAAQLFGLERQAIRDKPFTRFIIPEDQDAYYQHRLRLFETGERQACEIRMLRQDGSNFWGRLEATVAPGAESGKPVFRTTISDITEGKRLEAALLESEQSVRRLNECILNMVMVLSHDIRGPIVAIASTLKLMLRGAYGKLDPGLTNTVQDLLARSARLLGTAEDYLGKAAIVEGSIVSEREALDLRQDIIDAVLEELVDQIARQEIFIDNRLGAIPAGSIIINVDKTWLKAVYRNLFSNAIKYGGKGCTISFGFEPLESHFRLNVYNSGAPVAEEDRRKLFTRFGRIHAPNGPIPDGVGLGLCLVREIVQAHGGEIWYEAQPDGSNFIFTLPRENEDATNLLE